MELETTKLDLKGSYRLVRSRYPTVGVLDTIVEPEDLEFIIALEGWTNDRLSSELGNIFFIPKQEWVIGMPMATVIMAAFCHPHPNGGRFNSSQLGAWYAAFKFDTAVSEIVHHLRKELQEVGQYTRIHLREYLADFNDEYIDARATNWKDLPIYNPNSYSTSQEFAQKYRDNGAVGIVYNSVRNQGGHCIVCFKPKKIINVRQARHFEIKWDRQGEASIVTL